MFEGDILDNLEKEVNAFMLTTTRIYNVKHMISNGGDRDFHYFMVSYEP